MTPSIHNNDSHHDVLLDFKTKKHKNQLSNNLRKNKGTRIHINNLDDIKVHDGNGFFESIKSFFNNPMIKKIAKTAAPYAGQLASVITKSPLAGQIVNSGLNAYAGSGIFDELRNVATKGYNFVKRVAAHPTTKKLIQKATPYITDYVHKKQVLILLQKLRIKVLIIIHHQILQMKSLSILKLSIQDLE